MRPEQRYPAAVSLAQIFAAAWSRRDALHADPTLDAYRLFHGWDEGCRGLEIDRYGDAAVVTIKPSAACGEQEVIDAIDACRRFPLIVIKSRGNPARAVVGTIDPRPIVVREGDVRFLVEPGRPKNSGLFLDARPARRWLRQSSRDRRVLNLFSFAGSLGVTAAVGGAASVCHVDTGKAALGRCRDNHALNGVPIDGRDLVRLNVYQHLRKQATGRQRFGGIIIDPPPLSAHAQRSDRTPGERGVEGLAPLAARMLAPGGWMLCFLHHGDKDRDEREDAIMQSTDAPLEILWQGESGPDFPESDPRQKLHLTAFVRR